MPQLKGIDARTFPAEDLQLLQPLSRGTSSRHPTPARVRLDGHTGSGGVHLLASHYADSGQQRGRRTPPAVLAPGSDQCPQPCPPLNDLQPASRDHASPLHGPTLSPVPEHSAGICGAVESADRTPAQHPVDHHALVPSIHHLRRHRPESRWMDSDKARRGVHSVSSDGALDPGVELLPFDHPRSLPRPTSRHHPPPCRITYR